MSDVADPSEPAIAAPLLTATRWAWFMVALPVAMAAMDVLVAATVGVSAEWQTSDFLIGGVVFGLSLWLASRDSEELYRRGINSPSPWWCAIGYPVYLFVRALKARGGDVQRWWTFGLSLLALLLYLVVTALLLQPAALSNAETIEQPLEQNLKTQNGMDFQVTCPEEQPQGVGATFSCTALAANGQRLTIEVKWTDENGQFQARIKN